MNDHPNPRARAVLAEGLISFHRTALSKIGDPCITGPLQEIQTDVPYENLRALIDASWEAR